MKYEEIKHDLKTNLPVHTYKIKWHGKVYKYKTITTEKWKILQNFYVEVAKQLGEAKILTEIIK